VPFGEVLMKRCGLVFLVLALIALAAGPAAAQPRGRFREGRAAAAGGWLRSLEQGLALARASGKPLMVVLRCEP
jgi:hypothetical protein